jgi:polysaccharide biosynthesis transport protein
LNKGLLPSRSNETPLLQPVERGALELPHRNAAAPRWNDSESDVRAAFLQYLGLALKHKALLAVTCALFLFGGVIVTLMTSKTYSSSTTIKIDRTAPRVIREQQPQNEDSYDPQFYETQYELIKSRMLADRVATALNLGQTDFVAVPQSGLMSNFLSRLLGRASSPKLADVAAAGEHRQEQAVAQIMGGLSVKPILESSIVQIRYANRSPVWAQQISIAVAEQYEKMILDMRFSAASYARNYLSDQLKEAKLKLEASEKQLIAYAQKEGIVDLDNKQPQITTELQAIQNAYSSAVANRVTLEQTWREAQVDGGAALPQVMSDSLIQAARGKLAQLRGTYQDRLTVLKPGMPEMIALQTQINVTETDIKNQINLIKNSIKTQYDYAAANEKALGEKLEQVKAQALDLRGRSVDYTILSREVDTNRSLYDGLLQQFRQAGVVSDAATNNVSIVDRALLPSSSDSPSLRNNLLVALVLGLSAGACVIFVIEILDDTLKTPEDMEEKLGIAVLGVTPLFRGDRRGKSAALGKSSALAEVMGNPTSSLAEAFRSMRTAIQFSTSEGAPRSLLVTSSRPGEGKSTTAACLALNFAQLGMRVLLVDADIRDPSLSRLLELDNSVGLSNYLVSGDTSGLIKNCSMKGVSVLTAGPLPPNPAELLAGPRLATLLGMAAESFEIVILDSPPVMDLADAPILSSVAEGTMLVVEGAKTPRAVVCDALKRLHFARARVVGGVLNKYHPKHASYGYGYRYSYGYGYGYGSGKGTDKLAYGQKPNQALSKPENAS